MASKKELWIRVTNNQEWYEMMQIQGLLLIEIFNTEYGPCMPSQSQLRNFKISELPSEYFMLVTAQTNHIHVLSRFKITSEPIWILVGSGKLITIMYGLNFPDMFKRIKAEMDTELKVLAGTAVRGFRSWVGVTREEAEHESRGNDMDQMRQAEKDRALADRKENYRLQSLELIKDLLVDRTIVLFFSNGRSPTGDYPSKQKLASYYEKLQLYEETLEDVQLNDERVRQIFCKSGFIIPEQLRGNLVRCVSSILKYQPAEEEEAAELGLGEIETRLASVVYGIQDDGTINVNRPRSSSVVGSTSVSVSKEESGATNNTLRDPSKASPNLRLPTLWTPETVEAKCSAMHTLYEYKLQTELDFVAAELPPPLTIIVFEATRSGGIEKMLLRNAVNAEILWKYGYFTSHVVEKSPRLVARTWALMKRFDRYKIMSSKLVVGLLEFDDDKLSEYLLTDPLYVSGDGDSGSRMAEVFFPPNFMELEEEIPMEFPDILSLGSHGEVENASEVGENM